MAKRISASAIKWKELEKRVPPEQSANFFAFKGKSEGYLRRMLASPAEPPKINWDQYKKLVPVPGLVEKFQSQYTSLKIPYPEDKLSASVDKQWEELKPQIAKFSEEMKKLIEKSEAEIKRINALPKFEDMTMEMVRERFPEIALDPVGKPTFWPHSDDEQLGYVDPTQKIGK
ncbi:ATP synthase subunit d, mitochondrial [Helicoverpa armigera]|uniref:ATP synthase subunit d, mitochondrial n=1 Tax=Helicoverpa armigera TaxID=29058 RepID=UPI000B396099|nr:hypothetical protein B5X24_HaOG213890 [Helicoverpa armigera]